MQTYFIEYYDGGGNQCQEKIIATSEENARAVFKMLHINEGCTISNIEAYATYCVRTYGRLI